MPAIDLTTGVERGSDRAVLIENMALVLVATVLSILFSGYIPYFNNNIYHLTVLRADYDLPQFAGDSYVQSLHNFSSGFWLLFEGSASWIPPKILLALSFFLSRLLMMAACLSFAARFGYGGRAFKAFFLLLAAVCPLFLGYAPGGGGLNIEYFSHSELANAVLLFSLSALLARRFSLSVFLACLVFFLNAFMAVWLAPLWLAGALVIWREKTAPLKTMIVNSGIGAVAGLPLVALVLKSILGSRDLAATTDYSYAAYLRGFYPFHFFLDTLPTHQLAVLLILSLTGLLLAATLRESRKEYAALLLAAIALLALGSLVPLVTEKRLILNLHFIRSAVLIQLLASLGLAMVASDAVQQRGSKRIFGLLLAALMIIGQRALPAIFLLLVYHLWIEKRISLRLPEGRLAARVACGLLALSLAATIPLRLVPLWHLTIRMWDVSRTWEQAGTWARGNTQAADIFLLPVAEENLPASIDPASLPLDDELAGFVATSGRSVWTNYKYGASPMWAPGTFHVWRQRYDEVLALRNAGERLAYARANGIAWVATFCDPAISTAPAYRDYDLCIYRA